MEGLKEGGYRSSSQNLIHNCCTYNNEEYCPWLRTEQWWNLL